ncbi:MAG: hypothetical protein ACFFDN_06900 [Candidatus Hodarchaeota archaeon]
MKSKKCKNCGHALIKGVNDYYNHRKHAPYKNTCLVMKNKQEICGCEQPEPENE